MTEGTVESKIEKSDEFNERVMNEISSLRSELTVIRQLLERSHSLSHAVEEYRYLPSNLEKPIRWGFIGVWGEGGSNVAYSVITNNENDYFDNPSASDDKVADFAAAFANPNAVKICKYLFRNKGHSREEIKTGCDLSDEELDTAVKPLLEWHFIEWRDGRLESIEHGVNYVVTLIGMVQVAYDRKVRRTTESK